MSKQLITKERYDTLKTILNNLPSHQKGLNKVYKAIGIGDSSASYIRRSVDYADYKRMTKREQKPKVVDDEPLTVLGGYEPVQFGVINTLDLLLERAEAIADLLNKQAERLDKMSQDIDELINRQTKKRGWL